MILTSKSLFTVFLYQVLITNLSVNYSVNPIVENTRNTLLPQVIDIIVLHNYKVFNERRYCRQSFIKLQIFVLFEDFIVLSYKVKRNFFELQEKPLNNTR